MKKEFKNFIDNIKNIKLSEKEKAILSSKISEFISFNPIRDKAYIPGNKNYLSIFEVQYFARATALILIIGIVVGGSGVSYAASDALPGEKLYTVKVNINEKIEESLALTTEAKVVVESKQVERRLEETQTLVKENKLSENAKKIVEKKLDEHIDNLTKDITTLKEDGKVEVVLETTAKLTPVLEVHKEILEDKKDNTESLIAKVEDSIQKVEKEEIEVLASAVKEETETEENLTTEVFSVEVAEDQNPTDISTMSYVATETQEIKLNKEIVDENIENIDINNEDIAKFIELRLQKAQEKIDEIKKTISPIQEKTSVEGVNTDEKTITTIPTATEKEVVLKTSTTEVRETKTETIDSETIINTPLTKEESKNLKLTEAEEAIKMAKQAFIENNFKEALSLTQKSIKLLGEIEVENKLKSMELTLDTKNNITDNAKQTAQTVESVK